MPSQELFLRPSSSKFVLLQCNLSISEIISPQELIRILQNQTWCPTAEKGAQRRGKPRDPQGSSIPQLLHRQGELGLGFQTLGSAVEVWQTHHNPPTRNSPRGSCSSPDPAHLTHLRSEVSQKLFPWVCKCRQVCSSQGFDNFLLSTNLMHIREC